MVRRQRSHAVNLKISHYHAGADPAYLYRQVFGLLHDSGVLQYRQPVALLYGIKKQIEPSIHWITSACWSTSSCPAISLPELNSLSPGTAVV